MNERNKKPEARLGRHLDESIRHAIETADAPALLAWAPGQPLRMVRKAKEIIGLRIKADPNQWDWARPIVNGWEKLLFNSDVQFCSICAGNNQLNDLRQHFRHQSPDPHLAYVAMYEAMKAGHSAVIALLWQHVPAEDRADLAHKALGEDAQCKGLSVTTHMQFFDTLDKIEQSEVVTSFIHHRSMDDQVFLAQALRERAETLGITDLAVRLRHTLVYCLQFFNHDTCHWLLHDVHVDPVVVFDIQIKNENFMLADNMAILAIKEGWSAQPFIAQAMARHHDLDLLPKLNVRHQVDERVRRAGVIPEPPAARTRSRP